MPGVLTVDQQLEEFWGWHPPLLEKSADHRKSAGTRITTHYDMHLDESLTLKSIVSMPSLLSNLENVVDKALDAARPNLPSITGEFPNERKRKGVLDAMSKFMKDEGSVANFYKNTTAKFCAPVASMLGLQHPAWIPSLIWDRQQNQQTSAIADGFLKINGEPANMNSLWSTLKPEIQRGVTAINKEQILHLAVWEFKSLKAGSMKVMQAIDSLKGSPFKWTACTQEYSEAYSCGSKLKHLRNGKLTTTGSRMAFDAIETPWDISQGISAGHKCKRKRDLGDGDQHGNDSPPGEVITDTNKLKACDIIQQTWAEAVRSDATLLVVNTGNFEFIGVRHRESRTLFLSPLIDVQNTPTYAKLHTGLYISAFCDTVDRALQLCDAAEPPSSWTCKYYPDKECNSGDENMSREVILRRAQDVNAVTVYSPPLRRNRRNVKTKPDLRTHVFHLPVTFLRHESCESLPADNLSHLGLTLVKGISGIACTAKLKLDNCALNDDVIVKHARSTTDCETLLREYSRYVRLIDAKVPGVAKTLGLFKYTDEIGLITNMVFVMLSAGTSFPDWKEAGKPLTASQRDSFINTLSKIHKAGYLHNNLRAKNLYIGSDGEVSIIGFSHVIDAPCRADQDRELSDLRHILG